MSVKREDLGDLMAFLVVAEERSFTRAAARLGTSQSALSHVVRRLEERLDVRLLTRTTRNVAPTDAGARLAETLRPAFNTIDEGLNDIDTLRERPAGTIRLTSPRRAARDVLLPVAERIMAEHPSVNIEVITEQRLVELAGEGYDAGVRLGERVEKDMIAVRIGPELRMCVAGTQGYFKAYGRPQTPRDLTDHNCINLRLPTLGGLYAWEFEKDGHPLNVRVEGQFTANDPEVILDATLAGRALACLPSDHVGPLVRQGALELCLEDWCPPFPGYHLYYPSRRQPSPAFRLLVEALRYRGT